MPRARNPTTNPNQYKDTRRGGPGAEEEKPSLPAAAPAAAPAQVPVMELMDFVAPKKITMQQMEDEEEQAVNELVATQKELQRKQVRAAVVR